MNSSQLAIGLKNLSDTIHCCHKSSIYYFLLVKNRNNKVDKDVLVLLVVSQANAISLIVFRHYPIPSYVV